MSVMQQVRRWASLQGRIGIELGSSTCVSIHPRTWHGWHWFDEAGLVSFGLGCVTIECPGFSDTRESQPGWTVDDILNHAG